MSDPTRPDSEASLRGELAPLLGRALSGAVRRLLDGSRQRLELRQLQRDREHFWMRLGKTTYHLVQAGELDHPALREAMARIDALDERIAEARDGLAQGADTR